MSNAQTTSARIVRASATANWKYIDAQGGLAQAFDPHLVAEDRHVNEGSSAAEAAAKHELLLRLARAGGEFALALRFTEQVRIAGVTGGNRGHRFVALGHAVKLAHFVGLKPGHRKI